MIKYNNVFASNNGIYVVLRLIRCQKSYYDVEFEWENNIGSSYFGSIMKKESRWEIFTNLDNYDSDYSGITFKTLREAVEYVGITDIENKDYFNLY